MKKLILVLSLIFSFNSQAMSPNEMYVIIGAVKYYNESCSGLNLAGVQRMNKGLKRYKMDKTPIHILEHHPLAISGYKTASQYGCQGTKIEAQKPASECMSISFLIYFQNNKSNCIVFFI